jgi:hypothetical protein
MTNIISVENCLEYFSYKGATRSIVSFHFFDCIFARVVWCHFFLPLDSIVLNFSFMLEWIQLIVSLGSSLGIPLVDHHKFQIFAYVACDILWFYRNKAFYNGITFDAQSVSMHTNKISLKHFQA